MSASGPVRIDDGPVCPNCGSTGWDVGFVGEAAADAAAIGEQGAWVELMPAPMARCAACGLSARLDADKIPWER